MKKFLLTLVALSYILVGYSQDLLVTTKGDSIRCKVLSQTETQIFANILRPDGTTTASYFPKDSIHGIMTGYFDRMPVPPIETNNAAVDIQQPSSVKSASRNNIHWARVAISGGYSRRLGKMAEGSAIYSESDYKTGFSLNADVDGFFNEYIGLGGFVNYRQYNGGKVNSFVTGAKVLGRFYNRTKNSAWILGLGMGYLTYKEDINSILTYSREFRGGTFGSTFEVGYELGMYRGMAFMINLAMTTGSLGSGKIDGEYAELKQRENASSFNLTFGFVFGR